MDGIVLIIRFFLCTLLAVSISVGTAQAVPAENPAPMIYAESPEQATVLLQQQITGVPDIDVMIYVTGEYTMPDIISYINDNCRLLTGLRYDLYFSLQSDYLPGQVRLQLVHKDAAYNSAIIDRVQDIAAAARAHSSDKTAQLRYASRILSAAEYDHESIADKASADGLAWSAYGCLIKGRAVCEGYTNALTLVCQTLDIPVYEVTGQGSKGGAHTWNKVFVDDNWYAVDLTAGMRAFLVSDTVLQLRGYVWTDNMQFTVSAYSR